MKCVISRYHLHHYFLTIVLYLQYQVKFDQFVEQGRVLHNYASILELLLRLRQCCDHPFLVMRFELLFMRLSIFISRKCCVTFQQALIYSVLMSCRDFGLVFNFILNICYPHCSLYPYRYSYFPLLSTWAIFIIQLDRLIHITNLDSNSQTVFLANEIFKEMDINWKLSFWSDNEQSKEIIFFLLCILHVDMSQLCEVLVLCYISYSRNISN